MRTELQNRFRLDYRFGFGILSPDDGMDEFSGWKENVGLWTWRSNQEIAIGSLINMSNDTIFNLPQLLTILYIYSIFLDKL